MEYFFTITGIHNYHGIKPFNPGKVVKLVKDIGNIYDDEAISVLARYYGKIGYVANSSRTVFRGTMSAGRLYDKITDEDYAEVKFIGKSEVIAKILTSDEIDELRKDPENDINFLDDLQ